MEKNGEQLGEGGNKGRGIRGKARGGRGRGWGF